MEPDSPEQAFILTLEATAFNRAQLDAQNKIIAERHEHQIALAGRSNVGKSTLVNALANRKSLAKTSSTPGKTRSINYYRVTNVAEPFIIVDLPGYGYACCPQEERNAWRELISRYLSDAPNLSAVALLIDCRLPPQKSDRDLAAYVQSKRLPVLPVMTKSDKCTQSEQSKRAKEWSELLDGIIPVIVSSVTKRGLDTLRAALVNFCTEQP